MVLILRSIPARSGGIRLEGRTAERARAPSPPGSGPTSLFRVSNRRGGPYNPGMRRRLLWLLPILLLVLAAAGYTAYWFYMAGAVRQAIGDWIEARRQEGFSVGADRIGVSGFPLAFRARLDGAVLAQDRAQPGYELRLPVLVGEAKPWAPRRWVLEAERGGRLHLDPGPARPSASITAAKLHGLV